ncbi:hypothetical protein VD0002_g9160 [Verticillium dahliae]|uniref:Uncharacterized protein n=1 Tax=Verticillium dahliae TaxID=27337 RepID=A0AA44WF69_VERDA|nr:hypothetical protein BJF96_g7139 [Verticillium dahliae]PNH37408.1 hypothetical protein VD0004_g9379 [Verticillium dahliae]PNH44241.1 hypothetical protein VD0003_g9472 [Verticillium dahliae]PNH58369.1 hypothetical protein VD0002_g9160 [Verticillium dahliae]PNH62520.1 hypothetical protein VD0001_g9417 [Verticillium dahliae]
MDQKAAKVELECPTVASSDLGPVAKVGNLQS